MSPKNWYSVANSKTPLKQGDIFFKCRVVKPNFNTEVDLLLEAKITEYDVIILSQSCDLENDKIDMVLVCPIYAISTLIQEDPSFAYKKKKEKLRLGEYPSMHLLDIPKKKGFPEEFFIVDFHNVFGVPIAYFKEFLIKKQKKRLSLISPFREHLAQAFARYLMRVGLPSDIPSFVD